MRSASLVSVWEIAGTPALAHDDTTRSLPLNSPRWAANSATKSGLRLAFAVAARAREHGNHPFGAILVDAAGKVLLEAENGLIPTAT